MLLEAAGLTVKRLGRTVLHDVNLGVSAGECVSIIGPNGAGKSTLMATLAGILAPAAGQVRLAGKPIAQQPRRQVARQIAYVPQIHDGFLGFRVRDVIESGRYAHVAPLDPLSRDDLQAIEDAIVATQVAPLLERTVDTLSGGERQKVWIAAALAQQSPVLLLDEPTNALDPAHQVDLIRIMRAFRESGGTLVVICHDLNLPLALGGRIVALKEGKVLFDQPAEVLTDCGRLAELFATDFIVYRDPAHAAVSIALRV